MKHLKKITLMAAIMTFLAIQGFAQNTPAPDTRKDSKNSASVAPGNFIDNNKDGVCDNYQTRVKKGQGPNFTDKNGDGVCDNRRNNQNGKSGCGMGYQHRNGQGQGNGCGNGNGNGCQHRHGNRK